MAHQHMPKIFHGPHKNSPPPNNDSQHDLRVLYNFASYKSIVKLVDILPKIFVMKTFNSEFSYVAVWFTDQNSKLLEIEDKINVTLVIN